MPSPIVIYGSSFRTASLLLAETPRRKTSPEFHLQM
jgi:hypothetical protein